MLDTGGLWADSELHDLIARLELRLEQYRLHAEQLERRSREREGADALVGRIEQRLVGLRSLRDQQVARCGTQA